MPIIEENMMDTNVGSAAVAPANIGAAQGMQQLGGTISDIMLDMSARRTDTETRNFLGAYGHVSSTQEEDMYQKLKSDPSINWNTDGDRIKKDYLSGMKELNTSYEEKAPNEVAKRELRLQGQKDLTTAELKLNTLHTQKVLETNEKLYTEIGGSSIAQLPFGADAASADQLYKKTATDLMKLGSVPFSNPDKIRDREKWYVTNYTEKFVQDGAISNPTQTLRTLSPDVARYLELATNKGMTSNNNGLAEIAYKGGDGRFYQFQFNASTQTYVPKLSSLDPSLYKGAFLVNLSTKEVELSEQKVMQSTQTPTFVKELIRLNPEKYVDYTQLLMGKMLVKKKKDVSLNDQAVKDTYKQMLSGKLTAQDYQRIAPIPQDSALFASKDNMGKVETMHKTLAPYLVGNTVFELRKNPTMSVQSVDELSKVITSKFNQIADDKETPQVQALLSQISPTGDVEEGREIYKQNSKSLISETVKDVRAQQDAFQKEYKKDAGAYARSLRTPEDQTRYDNFFGGTDPQLFKENLPSSEIQKLKSIASEDQQKLKMWNADLGLASSIMTKEEEKKVVDYIKSNTSNPEKVTTAITRLQEVMGNKSTAEFLDRSGLGFYRSMFATKSFALQSDLAQAFNNYPENKKIIAASPDNVDFKKLYSDIKENEHTQKLVNTIAANAGPNTAATASSIVSSVEALTYQYITKEQMSPKDAVKKAAERVYSQFDVLRQGVKGKSKYHLYAPKGGMGDMEKVQEWLDERATSKEFLEKNALVIGDSFKTNLKGYDDKELRKRWIDYIQKNGEWTTNDKGDGARLMYRDESTKMLVPVLTQRSYGDKAYIDIPYSDIQQRAKRLDDTPKVYDVNEAPSEVPEGVKYYKHLIKKAKIEKSSRGEFGLAPDTHIESSVAANLVDKSWIDDTMDSEGESLAFADKSYTMDRLYAPKDGNGFLHSMMQSNFAYINNPINKQKAGGSPIYEYDYNGKKVVSYLPLPPEKFSALSKEDQEAYYPTIEKAIRQTMVAWTKTSTNPEVATFLKGQAVTQDEFFGVADLWHVYGAAKLQGIPVKGKKPDAAYKELGDLLKQKKWDDALKLIKDKPILSQEVKKRRLERLDRYFRGNNA